MDTKKAIRKQCLHARRALDASQRVKYSQKICDHIQNLLTTHAFESIGLYHANADEVSLQQLLSYCMMQGKTILLPAVESPVQPLAFYPWDGISPLAQNTHLPFQEPADKRCPVFPDIVILPVVGFDNAGNRLGMGGGYYDRTLDSYRICGHRVITIGAAFSCQKTVHIPVEKHDQKPDIIVTETSTSRDAL
jgi:5-formyltetrahydrofolate cyclo-ligase